MFSFEIFQRRDKQPNILNNFLEKYKSAQINRNRIGKCVYVCQSVCPHLYKLHGSILKRFRPFK